MPYKRGKKWVGQVRKTENDQEHRREKKFDTKTEALAWESEMKKLSVCEWDGGAQTPTVSLLEWATRYLDYAKIKFGDKTFREKRSIFRELFRSVKHDMGVDALKPGEILSYLQDQASIRSGYAANKHRKNLVAAWNWGMKYMGLPSPNPCLVDRFAEERQKRYVPPESDFWKVYMAAQEGQDRLMLLTYLHTGARRGELFRLRWEDVDFGEGTITLSTRKRMDGSLEYDSLPMTDELYGELLKFKQGRAGEWVFLNPKNDGPFIERKLWMRGLCRKAEVKSFGLHSIRHLTASILAQAGVPTMDIQAILRHKKIATTERYLHRLSSLKPSLQVLSKKSSRQVEPSAQGEQPKLEVVK